MATVVYHIRNEHCRELLNEETPDGEVVDFSKYIFAAIVSSDNPAEVYKLTNTIEYPWAENAEVKTLKQKIRSTSVGDLFHLPGDVYLQIARFGFKEVAVSPTL